MASTEWKRLTQADLFKEYPLLEGWFADLENITAQLFDGERLQSAREKMDLFGGSQKVKSTIAQERRKWKENTAILMACRSEPMTAHEIAIFTYNAGLEHNSAILYTTINQLIAEDLLGVTAGLTYITRSSNPNGFFLAENKIGFLTTNVIWVDGELPAEERDDEAEKVAQLVGHPMIQYGEWISVYQAFAWKLIENLPWKFTPALRMAEAVLHPRFDWEAEAFRIEQDTSTISSLQLAMRSRGGAPLNVPWWGRPTLKLEEVISPVLSPYLDKYPVKLRYREFLKLTLPVIFSSKSEGEIAENIDPNQIPAYDKIIIKPFWFFAGEGRDERAVAEDPYRIVFQISGAPVAYMREEMQRLEARFGDGKRKDKIIFFKG